MGSTQGEVWCTERGCDCVLKAADGRPHAHDSCACHKQRMGGHEAANRGTEADRGRTKGGHKAVDHGHTAADCGHEAEDRTCIHWLRAKTIASCSLFSIRSLVTHNCPVSNNRHAFSQMLGHTP